MFKKSARGYKGFAMTIDIITHNDCLLHEMGDSHPECIERLSYTTLHLNASSMAIKWHQAPAITHKTLELVHDTSLIETLYQQKGIATYYQLGADVVMNPHTLNAARAAAGAVLKAVDMIYANQSQRIFCLVRPPGHHATRTSAMGFCFFNNVCCGIQYAKSHYSTKKILVIDFDVHHGNGTEDIIQHDENVLFCSSYQHPLYPFSQVISNHPSIKHLPLDAGTSGYDYRESFSQCFMEAIDEFKPELVFVSAGFDAHRHDPIGGLNLDEDDFMWLGQQISAIAKAYCQSRVIAILEGGYHIQALAHSVEAFLTGLKEQ
jgi:acetoin utilization deacetylase AcuC-like enzyme